MFIDLYARNIADVFVGRASKNQIRKVRNVLQQHRPKGTEQELIVAVGFLLSDVATDEKEQVTAAAKLYTELREGPMKPWNGEAADYERAEEFLSSEKGSDWGKSRAYNCSVAIPERLCLPPSSKRMARTLYHYKGWRYTQHA